MSVLGERSMKMASVLKSLGDEGFAAHREELSLFAPGDPIPRMKEQTRNAASCIVRCTQAAQHNPLSERGIRNVEVLDVGAHRPPPAVATIDLLVDHRTAEVRAGSILEEAHWRRSPAAEPERLN